MPQVALICLPLIAAFIGWLTNYLAVKMLFHPRGQFCVFGLTVQGVLPKRQAILARKIGELVSTELFSSDDIIEKLKTTAHSKDVMNFISPKVEQLITVEIPRQMPMAALVLNAEMVAKLKGTIITMLTPLIDGVIERLAGGLRDELNVAQIVEERVAAFSSEKLEELLVEIMKREFRFIELIGAFLGFVIGCLQLVLLKFT